MSSLSNSLAPQNMIHPAYSGADDIARAMALASGFGGMAGEADYEEAMENRRLLSRNAEEYASYFPPWLFSDAFFSLISLQTFFKDALDNFSENVTVAEAAQKLGLAHMDALLPGMQVKLMPHQIIGVQWMVQMERGKHHGGILADSMGLGKTIQATATMVANPSQDMSCKTTLIVAPLALLEQWKLEIEHKTYGQLSVFVFHGANTKGMNKKKLKKFDVVLTSKLNFEFPHRPS